MLSHILAALTDNALAFDLDEGKYTYISKNISDLTGYGPDAFYNNSNLLNSLIDPRDTEKADAAAAKLKNGGYINITCRIKTARGKTKWIVNKRSLLTDVQTGHRLLINILKDAEREKEVTYNKEEDIEGYSILFDNNPNPMWIYEVPTLRILKINAAAINTYGYTEEEFLTMTIRDMRTKDDQEYLTKFLADNGIANAKLHGFNNSGVWKHVSKSGEIIYAEINGDSISYKNYDCRIIVATNVTEKIRWQEEVKLREQFLNSLIDSQTNFLMRIDINGFYTFINKQFMKAFGYEPAEIIGHHFSLTVIPGETELCQNAFIDCISNPGKITRLAHRKVDTRTGKLHDTEWEFIAITNDDGDVTGVQGVGRDITEQKDAQKEIIQTKNNLEALINNTEDLIWSVDRSYNYLYLNQAFKNTVAVHSGKMPQKGETSLHEIYGPEVLDEWQGFYERGFAGEAYAIIKEQTDLVTEAKRCYETSFNPIYNAEGEITGVGCFTRDITERIRTNQAILDQNERLRNIAALSSHELRRPVATMLGLINIFDREDFYNPENKQIMDLLLIVGSEIDDVIRLIVDNTFTHVSGSPQAN